MGSDRFVHPDSPELIRSWKIRKSVIPCDALGQRLLQAVEASVLEVIALDLQFVLVDREPDERRGSCVVRHEMQREGSIDYRRRSPSNPSPRRSRAVRSRPRAPTTSRTQLTNNSHGATPELLSNRSTYLIPDFGKIATRWPQIRRVHECARPARPIWRARRRRAPWRVSPSPSSPAETPELYPSNLSG
jgi:hypothetical protein